MMSMIQSLVKKELNYPQESIIPISRHGQALKLPAVALPSAGAVGSSVLWMQGSPQHKWCYAWHSPQCQGKGSQAVGAEYPLLSRRKRPFRLGVAMMSSSLLHHYWALPQKLLKARCTRRAPSIKSPFMAVQSCDATICPILKSHPDKEHTQQVLGMTVSLAILLPKKAKANPEPKEVTDNKWWLFHLQYSLYSLRRLCNRHYIWQEWIYPWRGSK